MGMRLPICGLLNKITKVRSDQNLSRQCNALNCRNISLDQSSNLCTDTATMTRYKQEVRFSNTDKTTAISLPAFKTVSYWLRASIAAFTVVLTVSLNCIASAATLGPRAINGAIRRLKVVPSTSGPCVLGSRSSSIAAVAQLAILSKDCIFSSLTLARRFSSICSDRRFAWRRA